MVNAHAVELLLSAGKLSRRPEDPEAGRKIAEEVALEAGIRADELLSDRLWQWSDVKIVRKFDAFGKKVSREVLPIDPDFKTDLTLPVYSLALAI